MDGEKKLCSHMRGDVIERIDIEDKKFISAKPNLTRWRFMKIKTLTLYPELYSALLYRRPGQGAEKNILKLK